MEIDKEILAFLVLLGFLVCWGFGFYAGYVKGASEREIIPATSINMSCSVYPDQTMCCSPLIKQGNSTFAFVPPSPDKVEKIYICEYNTTIADFTNCTKVFDKEEALNSTYAK